MQFLERVKGSWYSSHVKQHSLKTFHNISHTYSRHGIVFFFFFLCVWSDLTPPSSLLSQSLTHCLHISIFSFTLLSLLPQRHSFSRLIPTPCFLFSVFFFSTFISRTFSISSVVFSLSQTSSHTFLFFCCCCFGCTDASLGGRDCSDYLKASLCGQYGPAAPSGDPQFWSHSPGFP